MCCSVLQCVAVCCSVLQNALLTFVCIQAFNKALQLAQYAPLLPLIECVKNGDLEGGTLPFCCIFFYFKIDFANTLPYYLILIVRGIVL